MSPNESLMSLTHWHPCPWRRCWFIRAKDTQTFWLILKSTYIRRHPSINFAHLRKTTLRMRYVILHDDFGLYHLIPSYTYIWQFPGKWVTHLVVPVISWLLERLHERAIQRGVPRCRLLISCASTSRGCRCAPRKLQPRKRRSPWRGGNSQVPGGLGGK